MQSQVWKCKKKLEFLIGYSFNFMTNELLSIPFAKLADQNNN